MTIFGIIEGPDKTVVVNPVQLRMVIPRVEQGTPVCYLMWGHNDYVKVNGTLDAVLGKLAACRTFVSGNLDYTEMH